MISSESKAHKDKRPPKVSATENDVWTMLKPFINLINPFEEDNKNVLVTIYLPVLPLPKK